LVWLKLAREVFDGGVKEADEASEISSVRNTQKSSNVEVQAKRRRMGCGKVMSQYILCSDWRTYQEKPQKQPK